MITKQNYHSPQIQTVIVDEISKVFAMVRSYVNASESDGVIFLENSGDLETGDMRDVKIKSSEDYDFYADPK